MSVQLLTPLEKATHAWECANVDRADSSRVDVATAQAVCGYLWQLARMPGQAPRVRYVAPDQDGYISGALAAVTNHGLSVELYQPKVATTVVVHEVAHLLTECPLAQLECRQPVERLMHGPVWLANYVWLLDRTMGPLFNTFRLRATMPPALQPQKLPFYPTIRGVPRGDLA